MDEDKRNLKGSEKRDTFKHRHKKLSGKFYATDADLCLVSKWPPGTVAYLDYKGSGEPVTFSEVIQYNVWMAYAPVFIIEGADPENGPFTIKRYLGGDWRPDPPVVKLETVERVANWDELEEWEGKLRREYERRKGWNGKLKVAPG